MAFLRALFAALAAGASVSCFADNGLNTGTAANAGPSSETTTDEPTTGQLTTEPTTDETTDKPITCGDARPDDGEECDYGALNNGQNGSLCKEDCRKNVCGDGYLAMGEGCDDGNAADDDACNNACIPARCGDGLLGPGEACDDGNLVDDDACSNACTPPLCGDGKVGVGEECDDGRANADDGTCKLDCTIAVCGDGQVHTGIEDCDDGNLSNDDSCTSDCTLNPCGNGVLDGLEACDDGNFVDGDTCSPACERLAYMVFVTSERYPGNLNGVYGASKICNELATIAQLPGAGNYRAWLSDDENEPADDFFKSALPYRRPDATTIAMNWVSLTTDELLVPIAQTETKQLLRGALPDCTELEALVWSNTLPSGAEATSAHCDDWSTGASGILGRIGNLSATNNEWTTDCQLGCDTMARLYCFEQP